MKHVAKVVLIDPDDNYLMMWRSGHPTFPDDPDLPGGEVESGETSLEGAVREVSEEAGILLDPKEVIPRYSGSTFSDHDTVYDLFEAKLDCKAEVFISWEHKDHRWMSKTDFLAHAESAIDTYMHMVHEVMQ